MLKQLDDDRFIVKASSGPRYVVGCRNKLDKAALKPGTRVSLDMTTLTIMRKLPREVRSRVYLRTLGRPPAASAHGAVGCRYTWARWATSYDYCCAVHVVGVFFVSPPGVCPGF